ncbi:MAG TPA: aminotransferase class III-fold pyridoxal phosphate-dependent enzyme [Terriglobales bacterium]|nr:aminotransferase class III-fold pyridoxal phosphate-dependent enzyme [Terriglobales bacterium]
MRHSALLTRSLSKQYPVAVRGEGPWIFDESGNRYLDFCGSAAVNFIGHGVPAIAEAVAEQLKELEFVHSSQFVTPIAQRFADEVLAFAGPNFAGGAVFFVSGGSEAVETALKLARQYQVEVVQSQRTTFLSRKQSYHGATFGAMSVSGNRKRKQIYEPLLLQYEQVNTPYCYRCRYGCSNCATRYAQEVEDILEYRGKETAAFIFEPVSGATIGAAVPPDGYVQKIVKTCHDRGVLVIADEVMTGFGRTGRNFAIGHWTDLPLNAGPDIITCAKGIASGYAPLGAVIVNKKVVDAISHGSGALVHGFTYNAHPVSLTAGSAVLKIIRDQQLVCRADSNEGEAGTAMKTSFHRLLDSPVVGDVRGIGLLWGVEFVSNKNTKSPYATSVQFANRVAAAAVRRGVMAYPMQGCVDGERGDHLLLAPPAIITPAEIAWAVEQLALAITEIHKDVH